MSPVSIRRVCFIIGVFGGLGGGCSTLLDWDPGGLPCEEDTDTCAAGYTCLVNKCLLDEGVKKGETCNSDALCEEGLICGGFTCASPCDTFYESTAKCGAMEYCAEHLFEGAYRGHCESGESCEKGESCDDQNHRKKCVPVTSGVNACLLSCEVTWESGTTYTDSCGGTGSQLQYCQPLGTEEELVCRNTTPTAQEVLQPCDVVEKTCKRGLACINGRCREYCNPLMAESGGGVSEQCGGDYCCPNPYGTYHVCLEGCNF